MNPVQVALTISSAHSLYDTQGNRVPSIKANATNTPNTTIYFDGYTETVISASGRTTTTKYYSANGQRIPARVGGSTLDYLLSEPLGSNSSALNRTRQVISLQHYSAYGARDLIR